MQAGDIVRASGLPHMYSLSVRLGVVLSVRRGAPYKDYVYVRWIPWEDEEGFHCLFLDDDLVVVDDPEEAVLLRLAYPELCGS